MKTHRLASLFCVAAFLINVCFCACAEGDIDKVGNAFHGGKLQELLNSGVNCDLFAVAEYKHGAKCDFAPFCSFLREELEIGEAPVLSRMRMAIAYALITGDAAFTNDLLSEAKNDKKLMTVVFSLHMINVGATCDGITSEGLIAELLSRRLDDGGWAVTGKYSDVDVTAMVLQALAPYKENHGEPIDGALDLLSKKQQPDGDFVSYGVANPESTAQVIIALTSLGIDALSDGRFVKNGKTLLDGIKKYIFDDGSVCHTSGGEPNATAAYQTFCALVALELFENGEAGLYMPSKKIGEGEENVSENESTTVWENDEGTESDLSATDETSSADEPSEDGISIKALAVTALSVTLLASAAVMTVKKRRYTDIIIVLAVGAALIACISFISIKSPDSESIGSEAVKQNTVGSVTISIRCEAIGTVFLSDMSVEIEEGETVYDILSQAAESKGILLCVSKNTGGVYVSAIGGVGEFDFGDGSGWKYSVNGIAPMTDASSYVLSDGDVIEWFYVVE